MLTKRLKDDLTEYQKQRNAQQVLVLRMLLSELHNEEMKKHGELTDEDVIKILQREKKRRQEACNQFKAAGRVDLTEQEEFELQVIGRYLPDEMSDEELDKAIIAVIEENKSVDRRNFGQVMGMVMKKIAGRADGARVSQKIREHFPNEQ